MCRFTFYLGEPIRLDALIDKPEHSLIRQSYQSEERAEPLNGDGFGVAWYAPDVGERPALFRSISPAWSNRNLLEIARVVRSPCVLAHIRAATPGSPVAEANCHPFVAGRYTFMHNGHVAGFPRIRRKLMDRLSDDAFSVIAGTTDSEHLFALFLDHLARQTAAEPADAMASALAATLEEVVALVRAAGVHEPSYLNIAVADGEHAVVSRFTTDQPQRADSLHYEVGRRYTTVGEVAEMRATAAGRGSVLVSSERLSDDASWKDVPPNHAVVIHGERHVRVVELRIPAATAA